MGETVVGLCVASTHTGGRGIHPAAFLAVGIALPLLQALLIIQPICRDYSGGKQESLRGFQKILARPIDGHFANL